MQNLNPLPNLSACFNTSLPCSLPLTYYLRRSVSVIHTHKVMDLIHLSMSDALAILEPGDRTTSRNQTQNQTANTVPLQPSSASGTSMIKKRASRACRYCREKKIKCSLVKSGSPCNTCQLDEVECVVTPSRRNKNRPAAHSSIFRLASLSSNDHPSVNFSEQVIVPVELLTSPKSTSPQYIITSSSSIGTWTIK